MSIYRGQRQNLSETFDGLRADYDMSKHSRFVRRRTGLAPQGGSADYHNRNETQYYENIEKARDMDRNDSVIGQIIDRSVANEVQEGFTLDVKTGDAGADEAIKARWESYANDPEQCDIACEKTFYDFEIATSRSSKLDGDCVVTGLFDEVAAPTGPLQFFEGHNIGCNKPGDRNIVLGVEMDDYRKRLRYYVSKDLIDPYKTGIGRFGAIEEPIDVRDESGVRQLFHVYNPKRTTLTRGVTALAPVFQLAGMFEDVNFAKVVQQQIVSCFAIFRKQSMTGGGLPSVDGRYGDTSTETSGSAVRQIDNIRPGMEIVGAPGEELQGFSPNVPNSEYFEHVKLILQLIGVNLGLPLCLVLMDGSETNFSGWRGAVDEARKGFRRNQRNHIKRFHTPAYLWKLQHFLAEDAALRTIAERSDVNINGHEWHPQAWPYIEPLKDGQGDAFQVKTNLNSPRRIQVKNGRQWDVIVNETVADNALAIRAAKEEAKKINSEYPSDQEVHWRELINLPLGEGVKLDFGTTQPEEPVDGGTENIR